MALLPWNGARLKGICYVFGETGIAMLGLMLEAISLRSFSTLWYWIAVAVFWVRSLRGVMGISHGMVARARRGGAALAHLEAAAHAQAADRRAFWLGWQIWIVAGTAAWLGALTALGFGYGFEAAQALWFIAAPHTVLAALDLRVAGHILGTKGRGDALMRLIFHFNIYRQIIGMMFVLVTFGFGFIHMAQAGFFR